MADYSAELDKTEANGLALQGQRQGMADANALRRATQSFGNDTAQNLNALQRAGLYKEAAGYQKQILDAQKAQSDITLNKSHAGKFDQEVAASKQDQAIKAHEKHLQDLQGVSSPDDFMQWVRSGVGSGALDLTKAADLAQTLQQDPTQFEAIKQKMLANGVALVDRYKQEQENARNTATNATRVQTTQMTNDTSVKTTGMNNATSVKTTGMTNATSRENTKANITKDYNLAGMNPDGSYKAMPAGADGAIDLTKIAPEDLAAANRYKTDGTLPPNMGRGAQGAMESRKIRAIASALDAQSGETPEDARIRQLALKGDVSALNKMRQREIAVGANVKNFDFNADQALQLSQKVDRTGVPIVNAWLNAGRRSVTGNPELAAFDVAVKTTVNEFAQIVSGTTAGATTEGEKKKAEALLNSQQTPEQIVAVINQMKVESQNRMKSFAAQRAEAMPTNGAKPAASPGGSPAAGGNDIAAAAAAEIERRQKAKAGK